MISNLLFCLVVGVTDGDTLRARCGEPSHFQQVTIRISAIDAPEARQAYGRRSRQALSDLCFREQAKISVRSRDRYGRSVADVECRGLDVATYQISAGMAWYYVRYGKGYERLAEVQNRARSEGRGLWEDKDPTPPWAWRRDRKR